jgi:hypothetical protein
MPPDSGEKSDRLDEEGLTPVPVDSMDIGPEEERRKRIERLY